MGHLVRLIATLARSTRVVDPYGPANPSEVFAAHLARAHGLFSDETEEAARSREPLFDERDLWLVLFWAYAGGWTALLLALRVGVMEAYTLPGAAVLIVAGMRLERPLLLRAGLALAFVPSSIAALFADPSWARYAFLIAGGAVCMRYRDARHTGGMVIAVGISRAFGIGVEPVAVLAGLVWLVVGPKPVWHSSWRTLGPPLALILVPPLIASLLAEPSWVRQGFLLLGSALIVVIGLRRQLRAPVTIGAVVLAAAVVVTVWRMA